MNKIFTLFLLFISFCGFSQQITFEDFLKLAGKDDNTFTNDISDLFKQNGLNVSGIEKVSEYSGCSIYYFTNEHPFSFIINPCIRNEEVNRVLILSTSSIMYDEILENTKKVGIYLGSESDSEIVLYTYEITPKFQVNFSKLLNNKDKIVYTVRLDFEK